MTLHKTVEIAKKFLIGIFLGIAAIIVFMLLFRLGVMIKNIIFPPKTEVPNHLFGILPPISFPQNASNAKFTYETNTVTGEFPEFPDRVNVYQITKPQPNLLNLNKAKEKVKEIGMVNASGNDIQEIALGNGNYVWIENTGIRRRLTFDTVSFDFNLESSYLSSPDVLKATHLANTEGVLNETTDFLEQLKLLPKDLDLKKTKFEFLSIKNGVLTKETNPSKAQVVRVDLQQKNLDYDLNTGIPDLMGGLKKTKMSLPILYSRPPYSTMSFWLASGEQSTEVTEASFVHKTITIPNVGLEATYYIKTSREAFEELQKGNAYVATYLGPKTNIVINNIYLAYYLDESTNEYLMPIIVFEGDNGFFAYVSAIKTEWVK